MILEASKTKLTQNLFRHCCSIAREFFDCDLSSSWFDDHPATVPFRVGVAPAWLGSCLQFRATRVTSLMLFRVQSYGGRFRKTEQTNRQPAWKKNAIVLASVTQAHICRDKIQHKTEKLSEKHIWTMQVI